MTITLTTAQQIQSTSKATQSAIQLTRDDLIHSASEKDAVERKIVMVNDEDVNFCNE